jgi:hypothetical protein
LIAPLLLRVREESVGGMRTIGENEDCFGLPEREREREREKERMLYHVRESDVNYMNVKAQLLHLRESAYLVSERKKRMHNKLK